MAKRQYRGQRKGDKQGDPKPKGYGDAAFASVEEKLESLQSEVAGLHDDYDKGSRALGEAKRLLGLGEKKDDEEVDYSLVVKTKDVGRPNANTLKNLSSVLQRNAELEARAEEEEGESKTEFADRRIAELNQLPYAELEAARTDNKAYEKLIASTHYPLGEEDAAPTYATDWVNQQLAYKNRAEGLCGVIEGLTKQVKESRNPPKQKKDEAQGQASQEGGKKEGNSDGKKKSKGRK